MNKLDIVNNNGIGPDGKIWNPPNSKEWINYSKKDILFTTTKNKQSNKYIIPGWFINSSKDKILHRYLDRFLRSRGRTIEEYYVRFVLNDFNILRCKNPECNKPLKIYGKFCRGFNDYCLFKCQFAEGTPHTQKNIDSMRNIWKNPNSKVHQENWHRARVESARKLLSEGKMQAKLQYNNLIKNKKGIYHFYLSVIRDGRVKLGVVKKGCINYRIELNRKYRCNEYLSLHVIFTSDLRSIASLEYRIKKRLNWREYHPFEKLHEIIEIFRSLRSDYLTENHINN